MTTVLLVLFAILAGVVGGMGMGGGTVFIPLTTLFLQVPQVQAQGLNLVGFWFLAPVALFFHFKNKLVNVKAACFLLAVALPFSFMGALLANNAQSGVLRTCFGTFLILLSGVELYGLLVSKRG